MIRMKNIQWITFFGLVALPLILADIAALVAGGTSAIVRSPVRRRSPPARVLVSP